MSDALHRILLGLQELYPEKVDLSLDRLYRLLGKLGNPQDKTPPVIHVAGTNGKGSTIAYLRSVMEAAGYKCHVYTSPHLITFNERIRLAGELISDDFLIQILDEVRTVNSGEKITFFEITTAAAFLAYSRVPADVLLLEVGLGGLNDATNVVRNPFMTIITTISFDHVDWLGRLLPEIAAQKAGIMKPGVPCVIGQQMSWAQEQVMPVFAEKAAALGVPLIWNWGVVCREAQMRLTLAGQTFIYPQPNLEGEHQCWNAGAAIVALKSQYFFRIDEEAIVQGLRHAEWPGRLEHIKRGSLAEGLPAGWELWYDGGHNDSGGEVLGRYVGGWASEGPVHAVVGMLKSKDPAVCLGPVLSHLETLSTFSFPNGPFDQTGPSYPAEELSAVLKNHRTDVPAYASLKDAVRAVVNDNGKPGRILVTGTLYAYKELF